MLDVTALRQTAPERLRPTDLRSLVGLLKGPDLDRKEVIIVLMELVMFILSAFGLVAAGKEFIRRGHNVGLWGS